ncbi:symmetrical bis(5'-nucleosyl)-tetraphosphatase [Paraferrimonas haliotis]|uniref:bis(5'-nucleosyl)-tetraphosphatase (symmetrical) n=1 Tax=Paraferrimonas haliotis TaxID=2013866 RepID=A0AA37WVQ1_9GAMM|nr:symmetrical bis(5'-nucleosyl)-tetraphosphatase [Paraferrimonas haliotis]GLS82382.1 bis(5'-nucleosyl)-tetraphosphatase, symmetrical [Paraferrimonas haliotis]
MATYIVGDLQGCFLELEQLLLKVDFNPSTDTLWGCGDLIARGPDSLKTLSYFFENQDHCHAVLGNHDLHLLAVAAKLRRYKPSDYLDELLQSPRLPDMINWLRHQPLLKRFKQEKVVLTHAGLPPQWRVRDARKAAKQVEKVLQSDDYLAFIKVMYGDQPSLYENAQSELEKLRYTVNALTRMRYLTADGGLEFKHKLAKAKSELVPWFKYPTKIRKYRLVFGHWGALMGQTGSPHYLGLDTGCVWGNQLTMWHLESDQIIRQDSIKTAQRLD